MITNKRSDYRFNHEFYLSPLLFYILFAASPSVAAYLGEMLGMTL